MFLTFLGGVGTVTGSKTLVQTEAGAFLVDCGLFQGGRELRRRNWQPLGFPAGDITSVVLSHAHLDHCGYLPALVKQGFTGPIYCTGATAELTAIVLRDSARLQEEDTAYARKKGYSRHAQPQPLYSSADAEQAIAQLTPVAVDTDISPVPDATVTFQPAGHILGSATVTVTSHDDRRVVFSGDLGRMNHPLLHRRAQPLGAHTVVVESTYGDRAHPDFDSEMDRLADAITRTVRRGGTVIIPAFAVDRTEVLLVALKRLQDAHRIPIVPIYVDSPMALRALQVYRSAISAGDPQLHSSVLAEGTAILDLPNVHEATTPQDSMALDRPGARIIISASGMATGGRVVHHLKAFLPQREPTVVLVGYQAVGTLGRQLADGAETVKIHGRIIRVRAEIVEIDAFSVHSDADELIAWITSADPVPEQVLINHGEAHAAATLAARIVHECDLAAIVPEPGERIRV
jgi:metallo-beta-lactamase family protein